MQSVAKALAMQIPSDDHLWGCVPGSDTGHHPGPGSCIDYVHISRCLMAPVFDLRNLSVKSQLTLSRVAAVTLLMRAKADRGNVLHRYNVIRFDHCIS